MSLIAEAVAQTPIELRGSCERIVIRARVDGRLERPDIFVCSPILDPEVKNALVMRGESI